MSAALKRRWHRVLVEHPASHAWVLSLYRAGERHPQTVADYFPAAHAPWPELAVDMRRHEGDERKHERMYARAVAKLGEPAHDFAGDDVFNEVIRSCTPATFAIPEDADDDLRRQKLAHFLAHAHFLEARIVQSLRYHLEACERVRSVATPTIAAVLADEDRHVRYTREGVHALVDRRSAAGILDLHRRGEARANLRFSRTQVRRFLDVHGGRARLSRLDAALFSFCALLMEAS